MIFELLFSCHNMKHESLNESNAPTGVFLIFLLPRNTPPQYGDQPFYKNANKFCSPDHRLVFALVKVRMEIQNWENH